MVKYDIVNVVSTLSLWQHLLVVPISRMIHFSCINYPVIRSNPGSLFGTRFWAALAHSTPVFPRPPSFPCAPLFQSGRDGLLANAVSGNQSRYPCPERPPRDGYPRHLTDSSTRDHFPDTPSPTPLRETASPTPPPRYPTARALPRRAGDQIPISRRRVGPTTGRHEGSARLSGRLSVAILGASRVSRHPYIWVVSASMSSLFPSKLATDGSNCILGSCS
jgi:hypothetical protein